VATRETLDTLLVSSDQEKYPPEIDDFALRCAVVEICRSCHSAS